MEVFDNRFGSHRDKSLLKADWKITLQSVPPASFQIQQARSRGRFFIRKQQEGKRTLKQIRVKIHFSWF